MRKRLVTKFTTIVVAFTFLGLFIFLPSIQVMGSQQFSTQQFPFPPLPELSATQRSASTNLTCTLRPSLTDVEGTPQQIEGPYFVDGMANRSDIRSDTSDGSVQDGIPLSLILNVYDIEDNNGSCIPLSDAKVDIWHANSQGVYSGVQDAGTGQNNFLRGYQMTDGNGTVQFTTIYPGWYVAEDVHGGHKDRDGIIRQLADVFSLIEQGSNDNNCIYMA
jgi:protocatechuate 3,4-dioxygenase beta subunit